MLEIANLYTNLEHFSLKDINFRVEKGEYFVILGPSGAGKSVLLETVAGLFRPYSGRVRLGGEDITDQPIQQRGIGMIFQDGAVFPHLTVEKNIGYPLRKKRISKEEIKKKVRLLAEEVNIPHLLQRMPPTLSGGELSRVALARILALEPECLLLDEPLTALDVQLKEGIRELFRRLNQKGLTIVHVTHDYFEAFSLAHRIAIMEHGRIIQAGTPDEILNNPGSQFVTDFIRMKDNFPVPRSSRKSYISHF